MNIVEKLEIFLLETKKQVVDYYCDKCKKSFEKVNPNEKPKCPHCGSSNVKQTDISYANEAATKCSKCGKPQKENTHGNKKYCQGHSILTGK